MRGVIARWNALGRAALASLAGLTLGLLGAPNATHAQGLTSHYTFTRIADTLHNDARLAGTNCVGSSNRGTVVVSFSGELWRGDGHDFSQVAPAVGSVGSLCVSINDRDETAYLINSYPNAQTVSLVRNSSGTLTTLATNLALPSISGASIYMTPLNNSGNVAFVTPTLSGGIVSGIYVAPAGFRAYDGATDPPLNFFTSPASMNDSNTVTFVAGRPDQSSPFGQRTGIYRGSGAVPLIEDGDETSLGIIQVHTFTRPVINNSGTVAFAGATNGGSNVYTTSDGLALALLGTGLIDRISLNNAGVVAFRRNTGGGNTGLYTGRPGSINEPVIAFGDALDGSTFQAGFLWEESLNDSGQFAFYAFLEDGRRGIYRADPVDSTPPVFSAAPGDIVAEATSASGAAVSYAAPEAVDERDGPVAVTCEPAPGSTFALGTTPVSCHAHDTAGNDASAGFTVLVRDTTPPTISGVPADIVVAAMDAAGAVVQYAQPTAADAVSGSVPVSCAPVSGSVFSIGTTAVDCRATDAAGNSAHTGFSIAVTAAPQRRLSGSGYNFPETPTYRATFALDVRGPLSPTGSVQYVYTRTRMTFASTAISSFSVNGTTVNIEGSGTVNGVSGNRFRVTAVDGAPDSLSITILRSDGSLLYATSGPLTGGALTLLP